MRNINHGVTVYKQKHIYCQDSEL